MKLNLDCVRDIMLWAESLTTPTKFALYLDTDMVERQKFIYMSDKNTPKPPSEQKILTDKYSNEELVYHLSYCINDGLLEPMDFPGSEYIAIKDLTPDGHEYLGNIRNEEIYNTTKEKAKRLGIETVKAHVEIAKVVASSLIAEYLGLNS